MKSKPSKPTVSELADSAVTALELALGNPEDVVPAGYRTIREWAAIWGKTIKSSDCLCHRHAEAGRMDTKLLRVRLANGRIVPANHYKAVSR